MTKAPQTSYKDFIKRFQLLASKHPQLIINTLSNIFTMRLIGNKTHGDMAEIGIAEFVHQFMYDFDSRHVGKELFRSKQHEEDIVIINELTKEEIPISLKAYGDGPLQLSTDKDNLMFPKLCEYGDEIRDRHTIRKLFLSPAFSTLNVMNVMPLIYRESSKQCNIMVFDFEKMKADTYRILFIDKGFRYDEETQEIVKAKGRIHPIFMFLNKRGEYICEVRYGGTDSNALQRGLWTHTMNASPYFNSLTNGWISYQHNLTLVQLFRLALNSTQKGHEAANVLLQQDIDNFRQSM